MPATKLLIAGMECETCAGAVSSALRKLAGVRSVEVSVREGSVVVEHLAGSPEESAMIEAVNVEGYDADVIPEHP
jgi:copper chaperone CopZ